MLWRILIGTAGVGLAGDAFDAQIVRHLVAPGREGPDQTPEVLVRLHVADVDDVRARVRPLQPRAVPVWRGMPDPCQGSCWALP